MTAADGASGGPSGRGTRVADLTWPQAQGRSGRLLVVPLGATEQHGPHLPLSTDTDVARALAAALARRRSDVDVAPAVPYGASGEHAGFAGTLSVGSEALELLLVELVRSATCTWSRVLLAGATAPLPDLLAALQAGGVLAVSPNGVLGEPAGAGPDEGHRLLDQAVGELNRWLG